MSIQRIKAPLKTLIDAFPGSVGLVIEDHAGEESFCLNEAGPFTAASIIKLPILWHLYRCAEAGSCDLDERLTLDAARSVGGAGVLHELAAGLQPTIRDLAVLMIIISDNTATNLLIDMLGFEGINQTIKALGMRTSRLQRKMMDLERAQAGFENTVSAADVAAFFRQLLTSDALAARSRAEMLDILRRQQVNDRLSADLPEAAVFAHKTGQLTGIEHDAGIIYLPDQPVTLVVLTSGPADNKAAVQLMCAVGKLVYDHFATG